MVTATCCHAMALPEKKYFDTNQPTKPLQFLPCVAMQIVLKFIPFLLNYDL